jgi:hypothetical protein
MTYPSFFNIELLHNETFNNKHCICKQFKRILKYFMKGFYEPKNEQAELKKAKQLEAIIFNMHNNTCNYCSN